MKINKKGMTLVEIIVSIALISVVLIFLMGLFVNVRGIYTLNKVKSNYEIVASNIIKSVGDDIENYGLYSVRYENDSRKDAVIFEYNEYRPTNLSERIKKVLRVYYENNKYYVSYAYENSVLEPTHYITSDERITATVRELPSDVYMDSREYIELDTTTESDGNKIIKVKIPISDSKANVYDINIYGVIPR